MTRPLAVFLLAFLVSALMPAGGAAAPAPPGEHPGQRLARENHCTACHRIGLAPHVPPPQAAPGLGRAGARVRADWLLGYLARPKKLRPEEPGRMPDFRLEGWEREALAAFVASLREPWPPAPADPPGALSFQAFYRSLPAGDAKRGRRVFEQSECAKCHGDPEGRIRPAPGEKKPGGPDLREMSRKLTREGLAAILFDPGQVRPGTEMPSFFYDQGEPFDPDAPRQAADLTAYLEALAGPGPARPVRFHPEALPWGRRLARQFNCAGCHPGTGFAPRPSRETATPLGHRGAPPGYTREFLASLILEPESMPMHERMMGLARMPTFGFTPAEALAIADWLLGVDGFLGQGRGAPMDRMHMGPMGGPMP